MTIPISQQSVIVNLQCIVGLIIFLLPLEAGKRYTIALNFIPLYIC